MDMVMMLISRMIKIQDQAMIKKLMAMRKIKVVMMKPKEEEEKKKKKNKKKSSE
jgi:hypothetical protein